MSARQTASTAAPPTVDLLESDEARVLLEAGKAAGRLTADEIALAVDELELDAGQADELYAAIDELQIEVVESR